MPEASRSTQAAKSAAGPACHAGPPAPAAPAGAARVALIGAPNVGKSALFHRLTGHYVTVSNYPGTSVEVTRGSAWLGGRPAEVLDTPGLYSLLAWTDEERVARRIVLSGEADVVVHVVDAKALERMLPLTLQLLESGRPLVVALNMIDEASRLGVEVDARRLSARLGVAVVPVVAVEGRGVEELGRAIAAALAAGARPVRILYGNSVGEAMLSVRERLVGVYPVDPASFVALLFQGDSEVAAEVARREPDGGSAARAAVDRATTALGAPASYRISVERRRLSGELLDGAIVRAGANPPRWLDVLGRLLTRPATGIPVLLIVLYFGLYAFVGQFGAGTVVDWLEGGFERYVTPFFESLFAPVPWAPVRSLFVGEYGLLTLGLRYAVAIILPIVGAFFLFFSVLEDSGYFPRLALLVDRVFKPLGLSGRAVIPMVLGFACDTMATMVTRTLETRRERVIATLLLALAIPCSAQLGVILAILSGEPLALAAWVAAIAGSFLLVGALGARVLPGAPARFHMELPPLRRPRAGNVFLKTYTRMHWYFLEVLPLFLLASVLLWIGNLTGLFGVAVSALTPVVGLLDLPPETAAVFLFGFFRRDYGAAGLFDLDRAGSLDAVQLAVAAVTLTLFVPCIAQFLMMVRERGVRTAVGMLVFITPFAFGGGLLVNLLLRRLAG
ncbi:MAG: ferrous iron transport protein B [Gemmatimonadetes bacterium]|nr:ferrous iron transport protein B [Gemmatimonadota bacterium]